MQPLEPNKEQLEALYEDVSEEVRQVIDAVLEIERNNPPTIVKKIGDQIRFIVKDDGE
jgi:type IV secretory pathway VirB10-like protein